MFELNNEEFKSKINFFSRKFNSQRQTKRNHEPENRRMALRTLLAHLSQCKPIFNTTTTFSLVPVVSAFNFPPKSLPSLPFLSLNKIIQEMETPQNLHWMNFTSPLPTPIANTASKASCKITRNQIRFQWKNRKNAKAILEGQIKDLAGARFPSDDFLPALPQPSQCNQIPFQSIPTTKWEDLASGFGGTKESKQGPNSTTRRVLSYVTKLGRERRGGRMHNPWKN